MSFNLYRRRLLLGGLITAVLILTLYAFLSDSKTLPDDVMVVALDKLSFSEGEDRMLLNGQPFFGVAETRYPEGQLKAQSNFLEGKLNGMSTGWREDGSIQIEEPFVDGKSHGTRVKYHPNGKKSTQAEIVSGELHGTFKKWYPDGTLEAQMELNNGIPQGEALSFYPSGYLRSRSVRTEGDIVESESWEDQIMQL